MKSWIMPVLVFVVGIIIACIVDKITKDVPPLAIIFFGVIVSFLALCARFAFTGSFFKVDSMN